MVPILTILERLQAVIHMRNKEIMVRDISPVSFSVMRGLSFLLIDGLLISPVSFPVMRGLSFLLIDGLLIASAAASRFPLIRTL